MTGRKDLEEVRPAAEQDGDEQQRQVHVRAGIHAVAAIAAATPANIVVEIKTWACRGSAAKSAGRSSGMVLGLVFGHSEAPPKGWTAGMVRGPVSRPIDVLHLGRDRVICAYEIDGVIVDPGPSSWWRP